MGSEAQLHVAQFYIKLGGVDAPEALMNDLLDAEVDSSLHLPAMATLRFYDRKLEWADDVSRFEIGKEVEILANPNANTTKRMIFKGVIAAIEPEFLADFAYGILVVRAYDKSYFLHRGTKSKAYLQVSDSDIVSAIAGERSLSVSAKSTPVVREHVFRDDMTDYEFLRVLAARNGCVVYYDGEKLLFNEPDALGQGQVALVYGEDLIEFRPMLGITGQVNEVKVQGWDHKGKQAVTGLSSSATYKPNSTGIAKRGYAFAQSAPGSGSGALHLNETSDTQAAAEGIAKAVMNRLSSSDITGEGVAVGNPLIKAGCKLEVSKIGTRFSGTYFVTRVRHKLEQGHSYFTEFWIGGMNSGTVASLVAHAPRMTSAAERPVHGLMTAIVTNCDDPDKLGRVKVKYPYLTEDGDSFWAPVISVGAGKARGLMVIPEVNDEVVVGFAHGDINRPYVIGGLWNSKDTTPEDAVKNGSVDIRIFKSRTGHILRFTDESGKEKIELIDKTGKNLLKIDSTSNKVTITSDGDIEIEAKQNVKIKGMSIKLEATQKVEIGAQMVAAEAQAQIALKGAMAELAGSGTTKITGGMVMIN